MNEAAFSRLLLERGLVSSQQLHQLAALRQQGDPRPLQELVVQHRLVSPEQVDYLLRSAGGSSELIRSTAPSPLWNSDTRRHQPSQPGSYPGSHPGSHPGSRAGPKTEADASGRLTGSVHLSRLREGDPIGLEPKLRVLCERVLGEGGMGKVFLVRDPALSRPAALKLMKPGRSERRRKRFQREAKVTARLDHPGIPPVYLTGQTNAGHEYLLMRYVEGKSMAEVLSDIRSSAPPDHPSRRELLHALVKIGEAMAYAHSKGIVHRDLKPANVMIGAFGEVLVMDWGLARDLEESSQEDERVRELTGETIPGGGAQLTQDGAVLGTPGYLAPEQAKGEDVDPRADVFSLGCMLVEILTGQPPITGDTTVQVVTRTGLGRIELPAQRDRRVAPELNAIAARSLAFKRALRYPSVEEFTRDLRAYLEGQQVSVFRYGRVQQTLRLVRRHPTLFAALGASFVFSLGGLWAVTRASAQAAAEVHQQAIDQASARSRQAWDARSQVPADDVSQRIGAGLRALQAASNWRALAPEDPAAREALLQAATSLGELAVRAEQWSLAEQAFLQAKELDPERIDKALKQVADARDGEQKRIRSEVEALFGRAQSGQLEKIDDLREAVFTAVGHRHPITLQLTLDRLEQVTTQLAKVELAVYGEAVDPDKSERDTGEAPLTGLLAAVKRRQQLGLRERLRPEEVELIDKADERLERRIVRQGARTGIRLAMDLIGQRQLEELGPDRLQVARLACSILGRLNLEPDRAAEALGSYLAVENDGLRAVHAGLALCNLRTPLAQQLAIAALQRFWDTHYRQQVEPALARMPGDPPLEDESAMAYVRRGMARATKKDAAGARSDFSEAILRDPDCSQAYTQRAHLLRDLGQFEAAFQDYDKVVQLQPEKAAAWANRGLAHESLNDPQGALSDYDKAIELGPRDGRVYSNRALVKERLHDLQGARSDLERCVELDPTFDYGWLNLSALLQQLGEFDAALKAANRAIEINPHDGRFLAQRGTLKTEMGDYQGAMADFDGSEEQAGPSLFVFINRGNARRETGDLQGALKDLRQATQLDPSNGMAWNNLAELYLELGKPEEAGNAAMRAAQANSQPIRARALVARAQARLGQAEQGLDLLGQVLQHQPSSDLAYAARAEIRLGQGDLPAALEDIEQAIHYDPRDESHYRLRAKIHEQQGQRQQAVQDLDRAIELKPLRARTWSQRGRLKRALADLQGAVTDLSRALQLDPGDFVARLERGQARLAEGQRELALQDLDEAVRLRPDQGAPWAARGEARARAGDVDAAKQDLKRAVDLDPDLWESWCVLARVRAGLGDGPGALEAVEEAVQRAPTRALPWLTRGQLRLETDQAEDALPDLERALKLEPDAPRAHLLRGRAFDALGKRAEALRDYRAYLQRAATDDPDVEPTRKRVAELGR